MPTYRVPLRTHAFAYLTVEADSPEEAIDQAFYEGVPDICAQCSGWGQTFSLELNEEWDIAPGDEPWIVEGETDE